MLLFSYITDTFIYKEMHVHFSKTLTLKVNMFCVRAPISRSFIPVNILYSEKVLNKTVTDLSIGI